MTAKDDWPDGLAPNHFEPTGLFKGHANPVPALALAALMAIALSGILGGGPASVFAATGEAVSLHLQQPAILRNGDFFETRITVAAQRMIPDLKLSVDASLWRNITQNSMIPEPSEQSVEDGRYIYSFGPLEAGKTLLVQIDSQSNPTLFGTTSGEVGVEDGDTVLVTLPVSMKVLP